MINITPEQFQQLCNGESIIISDEDGSTLTISSEVAVKQKEIRERNENIKRLMKEMEEQTESEEATENREVRWGTCPVITGEQSEAIRKMLVEKHKLEKQNNSALYKDKNNGKD